MQIFHISEAVALLGLLSGLAGAVHILAPDHWVPVSVLSWQKGWGLRKSTLVALSAFFFHVLLGALIYFAFFESLNRLDSRRLFFFAVVLMLAFGTYRNLRSHRVVQVLQGGPRTLWRILSVFAVLGPCESIVPILVKSRQLGFGFALPLGSFLVGTFIAGLGATVFGQIAWHRPLWLPRAIRWIDRKTPIVPAGAAAAVVAIFFLHG